ncbi:uncharacterized protein LOC130014642 [Mercurialis annua]|uniref:uncharacterized protein LOC130014642 n=1 Tax=Mercurialis annua TaxID=3986 RepID=UPI0024ADD6E5|nr:uncharacterized protein LOC130014642 [Mercurialis annua]
MAHTRSSKPIPKKALNMKPKKAVSKKKKGESSNVKDKVQQESVSGEGVIRQSPPSLKKRHATEITKPKKKQKVISISEPKRRSPKLWQLKLLREDRLHSKIDTCMSYDTISEIQSTLSPFELELFRKSCFGYFLDIPKIMVQNQIIHCLLLREVEQYNKSEMWFEVGGHRLKFGIEEFALVSGLKCHGNVSKYGYPTVSNGILDKYFGGSQSISKQTLRDIFRSKRWDCPEDGFKLAFMHFLHNFLLASPKTARIPLKDFDVVDSDDLNDYPWGVDVFKYTFDSLSTKAVFGSGSLRESKHIYKYCLQGCPLVFLCWFYECCPKVQNSFVQLVNEAAIPRILKWQAFFFPFYIPVDRDLFDEVYSEKVNLRSIVPTSAEWETLPLGDFFKSFKRKGKSSDGSGSSKEVGAKDGYFPALLVTDDLDERNKSNDLGAIEEKFQLIFTGQKKIQSEISEFKRLISSQVSEVLSVVKRLCLKINLDVASEKVDGLSTSKKDATSSRDDNGSDSDETYVAGKKPVSKDPTDLAKSSSDDSEPILKVVSKNQQQSSSMHISGSVKEQKIDFAAEDNPKKDSFNASFIGVEQGVEDSVSRSNFTPEKEYANKFVSVNANTEDKRSDDMPLSEKAANEYAADEKAANEVSVDVDCDGSSSDATISDKAGEFSSAYIENTATYGIADSVNANIEDKRSDDKTLNEKTANEDAADVKAANEGAIDGDGDGFFLEATISEKIDRKVDDIEPANIENAATDGVADCANFVFPTDVGTSTGIDMLANIVTQKKLNSVVGASVSNEVPVRPLSIIDSPTWNISAEVFDQTLENAMASLAERQSQVSYADFNFGCIVPKDSVGSVCICPFDENSNMFSHVSKHKAFLKWIEEGHVKSFKKKIYDEAHVSLSPRLRLGVAEIEKKIWFYNLYKPSQPIDSSVCVFDFFAMLIYCFTT